MAMIRLGTTLLFANERPAVFCSPKMIEAKVGTAPTRGKRRSRTTVSTSAANDKMATAGDVVQQTTKRARRSLAPPMQRAMVDDDDDDGDDDYAMSDDFFSPPRRSAISKRSRSQADDATDMDESVKRSRFTSRRQVSMISTVQSFLSTHLTNPFFSIAIDASRE